MIEKCKMCDQPYPEPFEEIVSRSVSDPSAKITRLKEWETIIGPAAPAGFDGTTCPKCGTRYYFASETKPPATPVPTERVHAIRGEQMDPVHVYRCPRCNFPLNVYFHPGLPAEEEIRVHVACARCCWAENWGELKALPGKEADDAGHDREAAAG